MSETLKEPTVTVGCKLPHGLVIQLDELIDEKGPDGRVIGQKAILKGRPVELKGSNSSKVIGGYGLTKVDAEFFTEWLKQNATYAPVVAGLIFKNTATKAPDQAREQASLANGLEALDPAKPGPGLEPVKD